MQFPETVNIGPYAFGKYSEPEGQDFAAYTSLGTGPVIAKCFYHADGSLSFLEVSDGAFEEKLTRGTAEDMVRLLAGYRHLF